MGLQSGEYASTWSKKIRDIRDCPNGDVEDLDDLEHYRRPLWYVTFTE